MNTDENTAITHFRLKPYNATSRLDQCKYDKMSSKQGKQRRTSIASTSRGLPEMSGKKRHWSTTFNSEKRERERERELLECFASINKRST